MAAKGGDLQYLAMFTSANNVMVFLQKIATLIAPGSLYVSVHGVREMAADDRCARKCHRTSHWSRGSK